MLRLQHFGRVEGVRFILASVLAIAGCSAGHGFPGTRSPSVAVQALAYRGIATLTGRGDLAACPLAWDLEQYHNDMRNMRVDPSSPGYAVASAYDLRNRRCIELEKGERVEVVAHDARAQTLVRPLGRSRAYWTTANWTRGP